MPGLDISYEFPKPLTTGKVQGADVVITMGCGDVCPIYPGKRYEDWALPDPAGLPIEAIRPIRDAIADRVQALVADLIALATTRTDLQKARPEARSCRAAP